MIMFVSGQERPYSDCGEEKADLAIPFPHKGPFPTLHNMYLRMAVAESAILSVCKAET